MIVPHLDIRSGIFSEDVLGPDLGVTLLPADAGRQFFVLRLERSRSGLPVISLKESLAVMVGVPVLKAAEVIDDRDNPASGGAAILLTS